MEDRKNKIKKLVKENRTRIAVAGLGVTTTVLAAYSLNKRKQYNVAVKFTGDILQQIKAGYVPEIDLDNRVIRFYEYDVKN